MQRFFLALVLLVFPLAVRAQDAAPSVQIVDVLPTFDSNSAPDTPLISFDLLVGMTPRPSWWGQNVGDPPAFPSGEFAASAVARTDAQSVPLSLHYSMCYKPLWNEALELYTVHVRAPLKVERWPQSAQVLFRGELSLLFAGQTQTLPFEVVLPVPVKNERRDVRLVAPAPWLWIKAVRLLRVTKPLRAVQSPNMTFFLAVTFPLRQLKQQGELTNFLTIVDASGKEVQPREGGTWGSAGTSLDLSSENGPDAGHFTLEPAPFGFVTRYAMWQEGMAKVAPELWARQTFTFRNSPPLTLTVPVQREGKLLEGEIAPRNWKIESASPAPN